MLKELRELAERYDITLDDLYVGVEYLKKYGYLDGVEPSITKFRNAVKLFQEFFHLKTDSLMGPKTLRAMQAPRCQVPDVLKASSRWSGNKLKYYIQNRITGLEADVVNDLIHQAWEDWESHADINVTRANNSSRANMIISTGRGQQYGFDGSGGTLAWAQLPNNDQRLLCRFDLDETWIAGTEQRGILFRNVACHEFGHLLGLDHSKQQGALMAPYYNPGVVVPQDNDDVSRIQSLYGVVNMPEPEPTPAPTPTPSPIPTPTSGITGTLTVKFDNGTVKDIKVT